MVDEHRSAVAENDLVLMGLAEARPSAPDAWLERRGDADADGRLRIDNHVDNAEISPPFVWMVPGSAISVGQVLGYRSG